MLRFVVLFFALAALGLAVASMAFVEDGYYEFTTTASAGSNRVNIGLMRSCTTTTVSGTAPSQNCDWRGGDRFTTTTTQTTCTRDTATNAARLYGAQFLVLGASLLSLLAVLLSIPDRQGPALGRLALLVIATLFFAGGGILFYYTVFWIYCDGDTVCASFSSATVTCTEKVTTFLYLLAGAAGAALVGALLAVAALVMTPTPTVDAAAATDANRNTDEQQAARSDCAPTPAEGGRTPRRQRSDVSRVSRNNSSVKRRGRYGNNTTTTADNGDGAEMDDSYYNYSYAHPVASDDEEEEMPPPSRRDQRDRGSVARNGSSRRLRSSSSAPREEAEDDAEPASPNKSTSSAAPLASNNSVVTTRVLVLPRAPSKGNTNTANDPPPTDVEDADGWEWVAAERMYWNDASGLYLDPDTGLFYHPDSALWYDGTLELWYDQQGNPVATEEEEAKDGA